MTNVWVILDETKSVVVEVFETESPDSLPHFQKFLQHRPGCVFCGRPATTMDQKFGNKEKTKWYFNYFYWEDTSRWGYGDPNGIGWSAVLTLPEPIKMLAMVGEM